MTPRIDYCREAPRGLAALRQLEEEIVDLTLAIVAINGWNRLAITFHAPVGSYHRR